jgi:hypothetical protein
MEQCTLFVLGSQYVLKNIWVLAPFDPPFWLMAPFDFCGGPFSRHLLNAYNLEFVNFRKQQEDDMRIGIVTTLALTLLFQFNAAGSAFEAQKIQPPTVTKILHKVTIRNYTPVPTSEIGASCSAKNGSKTCDCPGQSCTSSDNDCRCG